MQLEEMLSERFQELQDEARELGSFCPFPGDPDYEEYWLPEYKLRLWATSVLDLLYSALGKESTHYLGFSRLYENFSNKLSFFDNLCAILDSAKRDYDKGYLGAIRLQIRQDVEGDLLGQAETLLQHQMKDPAAMLVGAVLEDALRQLCYWHDLSAFGSISQLSETLYRAHMYSSPQHQAVSAWATLRNRADHGRFNEYTLSEVRVMYQGVANFIATYLK